MKRNETINQFDDNSFAEDINDEIAQLEGITIVGSDAAREVKRYLAQAFIMRTLGASLQVARQQARLNDVTQEHTAEAMDDLEAALMAQHRDVVAEDLKRPEEQLEANMAKAKYFYHQLPPRTISMLETRDRILGGNITEDTTERLAKQRSITVEQAKAILTEMNAGANEKFKHEVTKTAMEINSPVKQSEVAHFTEDDYYYVLEKLLHYIGTKSKGYGNDQVKGRGFLMRLWDYDRRIRSPRGFDLVEADSTLLEAIQQKLVKKLEAFSKEELQRDDVETYVPHEGTMPTMS